MLYIWVYMAIHMLYICSHIYMHPVAYTYLKSIYSPLCTFFLCLFVHIYLYIHYIYIYRCVLAYICVLSYITIPLPLGKPFSSKAGVSGTLSDSSVKVNFGGVDVFDNVYTPYCFTIAVGAGLSILGKYHSIST